MISVTFRTEPGGRAKADIRFRPPTEAGLDIIRSVPGRKYDPTKRSWAIPAYRLAPTLEHFHCAGLAAEVEGKPWSPSPPAPPEATRQTGGAVQGASRPAGAADHTGPGPSVGRGRRPHDPPPRRHHHMAGGTLGGPHSTPPKEGIGVTALDDRPQERP
jgi:hypothetical protein